VEKIWIEDCSEKWSLQLDCLIKTKLRTLFQNLPTYRNYNQTLKALNLIHYNIFIYLMNFEI